MIIWSGVILKLLISSPRHIFCFDANSREIMCLRTANAFYYGISWNEKRLVFSYSGVDEETLITWQDYQNAVVGTLQGYFNTFDRRSFRTCPSLLAPHQIECIDDATVLVANTGCNCISQYQISTNTWRHIYLNDIRWDKNENEQTGDHFNSVHLFQERVWVVAHNHTLPSVLWELSWPSLEVMNKIQTGASWAHNIWVGNLGKVICDSKHGSLYEVDSGETIWKADEQPIVSRGLAVTNDYIFVGCSEYGDRGARKWNNGGLWIIDRHSLKTIDKVIFPGSGCVNEIRLIDEPDECHNGIIFNPNWLDIIKDGLPNDH